MVTSQSDCWISVNHVLKVHIGRLNESSEIYLLFLDHVSDFSQSDIVFKALTEWSVVFVVSRSKLL